MGALDLPPGIGLVGHALGRFAAPARARRLARRATLLVALAGAATWAQVARHPMRRDASALVVVPVALGAIAVLGWMVRRATVTVTRDGLRWGWEVVGFHQDAARVVAAHLYADGVAFEARRGAWWFLAARDWERFEALVRQLRRTTLVVREHDGPAPWRARLQSYGRFLDLMMLGAALGSVGVLAWSL